MYHSVSSIQLLCAINYSVSVALEGLCRPILCRSLGSDLLVFSRRYPTTPVMMAFQKLLTYYSSLILLLRIGRSREIGWILHFRWSSPTVAHISRASSGGMCCPCLSFFNWSTWLFMVSWSTGGPCAWVALIVSKACLQWSWLTKWRCPCLWGEARFKAV